MPLAALRRELHEETGLVIGVDPPHVWPAALIVGNIPDTPVTLGL